MLEKKLLAAAYAPSDAIGELVLQKIGGLQFGGRGLNKTAAKIGAELVQQRDARTAAYFAGPLPRQHSQPTTPIRLACVSVDGGRMQTREEGGGQGVHRPHGRETKNAVFLRMKSNRFAHDPHPDLPRCFADRQRMKSLLPLGGQAPSSAAAKELPAPASPEKADVSWRPERLFRTCLSSLEDSDAFGRLMEVEADARGFYHAQKKAFVCDGLPYNWTIQQRHFHDFTPILDFTHAIERLYEAASCVYEDLDRRWKQHLDWARACWRGEIRQVLLQLRAPQQQLGAPPPDCEKTDPRKVFADALGYFENNAARMDYPTDRREGLPTTSAHMESFVKELNARVKGTEKFWNDGQSGEAILQIRAAALSDDDRLRHFLRRRPGHPFHLNAPQKHSLATAT